MCVPIEYLFEESKNISVKIILTKKGIHTNWLFPCIISGARMASLWQLWDSRCHRSYRVVLAYPNHSKTVVWHCSRWQTKANSSIFVLHVLWWIASWKPPSSYAYYGLCSSVNISFYNFKKWSSINLKFPAFLSLSDLVSI